MDAESKFHVLMTADTVGGVWTHAIELAEGLGRRGVCVTLATMGAPLSDAQRAQAAALPLLRTFESAARLEWMADPWPDVRQAGEWLLRLEQAVKPDLVHLNQFSFGSLPFRAPTLLVAHSCVLSWWEAVHGEPAPPQWDRYRRAVARGLRGATLVAAPTATMLAALHRHYGHDRRGVVLCNGRSGRRFTPQPKDPLILSAGRLWDAAKNLDALEAIAPRLPWPVAVAGRTQAPAGEDRSVRGVQALGELAPPELARWLGRAAIYAAPARYEPFGQTALEAALSGCALVLGDIPSLREVWGPAALFAPPEDHEALRAALALLIADDALRERMANEARARAQRYTARRMVDAYLAVYRRLMHGATRAARAGSSLTLVPPEAACTS